MSGTCTLIVGHPVNKVWDLSEELALEVAQKSVEELEEVVPDEVDRVVAQLQLARDGRADNEAIRGSAAALGLERISWSGSHAQGLERLLRSVFACSLPIHPDTSKRLFWDLLSGVFMLFDAIMVPLVLLVLPEKSYPPVLDLLAALFWMCDMAMSLITGVYIENELSFSFSVIAWNYVRTWFFLDLLMVLPELVFLLLLGNRSSPLGFLRFLKLLRGLRLLRVLKIEAVFRKQLKRVNSLGIMMGTNLIKLIFGFLMLNHVIACAWYAIGSDSHGWFGMVSVSQEGDNTILSTYLAALHWSITQFHGSVDVNARTKTERAFAIAVLVSGLVTSAIFVSVTTDMIFQFRHAHWKYHDQAMRLRMYFSRHDISSDLVLAAKRYVRHATSGRNEWMDEKELLKPLPALLRKIVLMEARSPILEKHCLFTWLRHEHIITFRDICHSCFDVMHVQAGHGAFYLGDACQHMFFVEHGMARYLQNARQSVGGTWVGPESTTARQVSFQGARIVRKAWVCEPALWIKGWCNKGTMLSVKDCIFLTVEAASLAPVLRCFPAVHFDVVLYVRWVMECMQKGEVTDLWKVDLEFEFGD